MNVFLFDMSIKQGSGSIAKTNSMNYEEFIEAARDQLGDMKEYE